MVEITAIHDDYTFDEVITVDKNNDGQVISFSATINSVERTVVTAAEFQRVLDNEYVEKITIGDDLAGDFLLIEQVRDLIIDADNNKLNGNLTIGDGETSATIGLLNFGLSDKLLVDLNKGELKLSNSSFARITINSVGGESFNLNEESVVERLRNNSPEAK